jgi:hypothetical protein
VIRSHAAAADVKLPIVGAREAVPGGRYFEPSTVEKKIIVSPLDRYYDAVRRGDAEAIGTLFAEDAVFIPPPHQLSGDGDGTLRPLHGRAAIVERSERMPVPMSITI